MTSEDLSKCIDFYNMDVNMEAAATAAVARQRDLFCKAKGCGWYITEDFDVQGKEICCARQKGLICKAKGFVLQGKGVWLLHYRGF